MPVANRRILGILLLAVCLGGMSYWLAHNLSRLQEFALRETIRVVQRRSGARLGYSQVTGDIRRRLEFYDFWLAFDTGDSLSCRRALITYDLWELLHGRIRIKNLHLNTPRIFLALRRTIPETAARRPPELNIDQLTVADGQVSTKERVELDSVTFSASLTAHTDGFSLRIAEARGYVCPLKLPVRNLAGNLWIRDTLIGADTLLLQTDITYARFGLGIRSAGKQIACRIDSLTTDLRELLSLWKPNANLARGRLIANGEIACQMTDSTPQLTGGLHIRLLQPQLAGHTLDSLAGRMTAKGTDLNLQFNLLDRQLGRAALNGSFNWHCWDYAASLRLTELKLTALLAMLQNELSAPVRARLVGSGLLDGIITGTITTTGKWPTETALELDLDCQNLPFTTVSLQANHARSTITVQHLALTRQAGTNQGVVLRGIFAPDIFDTDCQLHNFPLQLLDTRFNLGVSGEIRLSGNYTAPSLSGRFVTENGAIAPVAWERLNLSFQIPELRLTAGKVSLQSEKLTVSGFALQQVDFQLDSLCWHISTLTATGVMARANGSLIQPSSSQSLNQILRKDWLIAAVCDSIQAARQNEPGDSGLLAIDKPFSIRVTPDTFAIQGLDTRIANGHLTLDLAFGGTRYPSMALNAREIDLHQLAQLGNLNDSFAGRISLQLSSPGPSPAELGSNNVFYHGELQATNVTVAGYQIGVDRIAGRFTAHPDRLETEDLLLVRSGDTSHISGTIGYSLRNRPVVTGFDIHARLIRPGAWTIAHLLQPTLDVRRADIYAELTLTGTPDEPLLNGQARLVNGELYLPDINQLVSGISAQCVFDRNVINLGKISGNSAGGTVTANGRIVLVALHAVQSLTMDIQLHSVEFHPVTDAVAIASGRMALTWGTALPLSLTGTLVLEEALITSELGSGASPLSSGSTGQPFFLDLKVVGERNIWLRNQTMDLELKVDLSILRDTIGMSVLGQLTARQGRFYTLDHAFRVTAGVLRADNSQTIDPEIDITAELQSRIPDTTGLQGAPVKIIAHLSGTISQPVLTLSSEPPGMSETDIALYLATNVTRDELLAGNEREMFNHMVSDRLLNFASRQLTSRLKGPLGIDVLELRTPSLTNGVGLKITVGKYLGSNLFVSYTASTTQLGPDAFKIEYFIRGGQELIGERTEEGDYRLRWQFKLRY